MLSVDMDPMDITGNESCIWKVPISYGFTGKHMLRGENMSFLVRPHKTQGQQTAFILIIASGKILGLRCKGAQQEEFAGRP